MSASGRSMIAEILGKQLTAVILALDERDDLSVEQLMARTNLTKKQVEAALSKAEKLRLVECVEE